MRNEGEPIGQGQLDRRVVSQHALRTSVLFAAVFGFVVLVNGLLLILLLGMCVELGWCELPLPAAEDVIASPSALLRLPPIPARTLCA